MHALASLSAGAAESLVGGSATAAAASTPGAAAVLVRLGDSGWRALLAALGGGIARNQMPAMATVIERVEPNVYRVVAEGRTALLPSRAALTPGMQVRFARMDAPLSGSPISPGSGSAHLSAVARALSGLAAAGRGIANHDAAAARTAVPLAPAGAPTAGPAVPAQWASQFGAAVSASGLFYESHLAQWVQGKRTLSSVRAEARTRADVERLLASDAARAAPAPGAAPPSSGAPPIAGSGMPDLGMWITQQLAALVTGQAPFRFVAWPGQDAEVVFDDGSSRGPHEVGVACARLTLELPHLGAVEARLRIGAGTLDVTLLAATPGARARLVHGLPALGAQFEAAGLRGAAMEVRHDPA